MKPSTEFAGTGRKFVHGPCISVLVRVKNEMGALPLFWDRLQAQTLFGSAEVIFLDSGSMDGTLEYLKTLPCCLHSLEGEFNFGRSCNQIAALATAPVLLFLSGHVLLEQTDALEQVVALLSKHPDSATCLRQTPNTVLGCSVYETAYLAHRFPPGEGSILMSGPGQFSNAASAMTRSAWLRLPFDEVHGSEDFLWAQRHLATGGKLFYMPQLHAMHSHNESAEQVHARVRINAVARGQTRDYARAAYLFAGVYVAMRGEGALNHEALRYAMAHASAYL